MSNTHRHLPQQDSQPSESTRLTEATALTRRLTFDLDKNVEQRNIELNFPVVFDGCPRFQLLRCKAFLVLAQTAIVVDFAFPQKIFIEVIHVEIDLSECRQVSSNWFVVDIERGPPGRVSNL
jgi:hypothetical protein